MYISIRAAAVGAALLCSSATFVQAETADAAILGRITEPAGTPLAGVTVVARNAATGLEWTVMTNVSGRYAFVQLPLGGPYSINARRIGYKSESRSGYELRLGSRSVVDLTLEPAATELAPVVIEGTEAQARRSTLGGNLRIGADVIARIPAAGRNFTDLAALAPTTGVQASLLGQRWTSTDIRIDGIQARNMLRAGEFGAGPFTLSMEAIREFEVSSTVYDVSQGRQGGGSIRAATKGGTNTWLGSVFTYYRGSALSAETDYQNRSRDLREFSAVQWGASIGGPIVPDKAHLFIAFDRQDSREPVFTGLVQSTQDESTNGVARDSIARLITILGTTYGVDTTRSPVGRLNRAPAATTVFSRLDWALNSKHRLTLTNDLSYWNSPLSGGVDQPITLFEARSDYSTLEQITAARLRSTMPSGLQNELKFAVATSGRELTPNSLAPRSFVRIQSKLADGSNGDIRVQFGGNRLAPDDSRETELQLLDALHFQRGNILYSVGTDNTLTKLDTYIAEGQSGLFEFQSLADLAAKRPFRYSRTLPLEESEPHTRQSVLEVGLFAQAEWRPRPTMTVTGGLRWDGTKFLDTPRRDTLVERVLGARTDRAPEDWRMIQPRAQVVWDITGDGRNVVRAGGGRFQAQTLYYAQHNQLLNDGARIADITLTGAAIPVPDYTSYRNDPSTNPGLPAGAAKPAPYVNLVDPDFKTPSVWKASAAYRRALTNRIALTGTLVYSKTTDNYMYQDRNLRDTASFALDNESGRPVFVPANTIDAQGRTLNAGALAHTELGRVLELTSTGRAEQRAAIVEGTVLLPRASRIDASYTWNRANDNTTYGCCLARTSTTFTAISGDPRDLSGSLSPADLDFRHKVVVSATAPEFLGVRVGMRYVGNNGRPFSAIVNGDINGDESTSNDLAFVFDPDDPATPTAIADGMRKVLNNPNNVAREYLLDNLGQIATRNGAVVPWVSRIDVRATRKFTTLRGQSVELGLDIFNFANLLNRKWGAEYQLPLGVSNQNPVVQRLPLLNVVGFDQATKRYRYTVNENFGVLPKGGNPYQIQLSLRYAF